MASMIWADRPSGFETSSELEPAGRRPGGRRRKLALLVVALLVGVSGFAQGARTAIGFDGVRALATEPLAVAPATRSHVRNELGGSFWAPRGSIARPPAVDLLGRRWTPAAASTAAHATSSPASSQPPLGHDAPVPGASR